MFRIKPQNEPIRAVCKTISSKGHPVYRILTEELAKKWNEEIVFTGDNDQCTKFILDNHFELYKD